MVGQIGGRRQSCRELPDRLQKPLRAADARSARQYIEKGQCLPDFMLIMELFVFRTGYFHDAGNTRRVICSNPYREYGENNVHEPFNQIPDKPLNRVTHPGKSLSRSESGMQPAGRKPDTNTVLWVVVILATAVMQWVALFYQHALGYYPCLVCVHVRLWVTAMLLAGLLGLFTRKSRPMQIAAWSLLLVATVGFAERCWHTFAVEQGWVVASCEFELQMPSWFAVDQWMPWAFQPGGACGSTPEMLSGVSMAEALLVAAVLAFGVALGGLIRLLRHGL